MMIPFSVSQSVYLRKENVKKNMKQLKSGFFSWLLNEQEHCGVISKK